MIFASIVIEGNAQSSMWIYQDTIFPARLLCTSTEIDGIIYVIGGEFLLNDGPRFLAYDPATGIVDTSLAELQVPRYGPASCTVNGKIYVMGGSLNYTYEYDPMTNVWATKTSMPSQRRFTKAVVLDNKIYVLGGQSADVQDQILKTVEIYDPGNDTWTPSTSMLTRRTYFAAEIVDGKIYVMGGDAGYQRLNTIDVFDPHTSTWSKLANMPDYKILHGSGVVNGQIYVIGGFTSKPAQSPTWVYDPANDTWSDTGADLPMMIAGFASSVVNDCLYTIGGMTIEIIPVASVYKYCPLVSATNHPEQETTLLQNNPNPFYSDTKIEYELNNSERVRIKIFNIAGQVVATLFDGFQQAGMHEITWKPEGLPPGIYFSHLQTESYIKTLKCIFLN